MFVQIDGNEVTFKFSLRDTPHDVIREKLEQLFTKYELEIYGKYVDESHFASSTTRI